MPRPICWLLTIHAINARIRGRYFEGADNAAHKLKLAGIIPGYFRPSSRESCLSRIERLLQAFVDLLPHSRCEPTDGPENQSLV